MRFVFLVICLLTVGCNRDNVILASQGEILSGSKNRKMGNGDSGQVTIESQDFSIAEKIKALDDRKAVISRLLMLVNNYTKGIERLTYFSADNRLPNAVEVLGSYRAVESVPLLMQIKGRVVNEEVTTLGQRESVPVFEYFFAAKALADIGNPAAEQVLLEITDRSERSALDIQLDALILNEIYGEKVSLFILTGQRSNITYAQQTEKLNLAMDTIENYNSLTWKFDGKTLGPRKSISGK